MVAFKGIVTNQYCRIAKHFLDFYADGNYGVRRRRPRARSPNLHDDFRPPMADPVQSPPIDQRPDRPDQIFAIVAGPGARSTGNKTNDCAFAVKI